MTTEKYQFPTDARFRRISANIADRVMSSPGTISVGGHCPLGAYCDPVQFRPPSFVVEKITEMELFEAMAFISGFAGEDRIPNRPEEFYRLGYAYRQRYTRLRP